MYKLTLTDEKGEELSTIVDSKDEIVFVSVSYDFTNNETVAFAFESNAEIHRESGELTKEEMAEIVSDYYSFDIKKIVT